MPASMIRAVTGSKLNVIGSSIAIVAVGPMPGQDADERAEEDADEAPEDVLRAERGREAEGEVGEQVHRGR